MVLEGAGIDTANSGQGGSEDSGFDANVAIATGELRQLLPALLEALGGLHERQGGEAAVGAAAAAADPRGGPGTPAGQAGGSATATPDDDLPPWN